MTFLKPRNIALLSLFLTACASPDPARVPVTMMGTSGVSNVDSMVVRAGETPEKIAKSTGMDITQLLEMNGIVSQQNLKPGQTLKLPTPQQVTVIEGDSIDTIAKAFGLNRDQIAKENNLSPPFLLKRGQTLRLPQPSVAPITTAAVQTDEMLAPTAMTSELAPVSSGPISTTENASGQKIHSSASGVITEQDLAPPPGASAATTSVTAPSTPQVAMTTPPATAALPPQISTAKAAPTQSLGTSAPTFSWPVNGSTLSGYGPKAGGRHNDGINIGAPLGTPVRTAAAGEVVYTGDNVAGFGNLILIRHSGGFATAYAHVQNPLVKRGEHVAAGQAIAQVGKSGNVSNPQLHFEVRKGTQAVNPEPYLP